MKKVGANRVNYGTGAQRSSDVEHLRYDLIPPSALQAVAERYALGLKYGEGNYLKGIPFSDILYHAIAHLENFRAGSPGEDTDVQNLSAVIWGCCALIEYIRRGRTDLDNRLFKDREIIPPRVALQMKRGAIQAVHRALAPTRARRREKRRAA